jgi:hypothetical protein
MKRFRRLVSNACVRLVVKRLLFDEAFGFCNHASGHAHEDLFLLICETDISKNLTIGQADRADLSAGESFQIGGSGGRVAKAEVKSSLAVHISAVFKIGFEPVALVIDLDGGRFIETLGVAGDPDKKIDVGCCGINRNRDFQSIGNEGHKAGGNPHLMGKRICFFSQMTGVLRSRKQGKKDQKRQNVFHNAEEDLKIRIVLFEQC